MQSRGPAAVAARAVEMTPADVLSDNGGGEWPHLTAYNRGDLASNGNFLESDEISVRHGVCGDPEQVINVQVLAMFVLYRQPGTCCRHRLNL